MILYAGPLSMFSAKAQIALAEKNAPAMVEMVQFGFHTRYEPKHAEVLRVNPKGQVPVLVDGDVELFDSTQIFEYLEELYPEPPLWPGSRIERAQARLLELKADEVFFTRIVPLMRPRAAGTAAERTEARAGAQTYYDEMEEVLARRPFLAGEYSYADIAFFMAQYFAAFLGADLELRHPNIDAWRERVRARPAVRSVVDRMSAFLDSNGVTPPRFAWSAGASARSPE